MIFPGNRLTGAKIRFKAHHTGSDLQQKTQTAVTENGVHINGIKSNETKAWFRRRLHHVDNKWTEIILQLRGVAQSFYFDEGHCLI